MKSESRERAASGGNFHRITDSIDERGDARRSVDAIFIHKWRPADAKVQKERECEMVKTTSERMCPYQFGKYSNFQRVSRFSFLAHNCAYFVRSRTVRYHISTHQLLSRARPFNFIRIIFQASEAMMKRRSLEQCEQEKRGKSQSPEETKSNYQTNKMESVFFVLCSLVAC